MGKAKYQIPPLHMLCSDDELRPLLNHVYIKHGHGYATDGYTAIRYDLEKYLLPYTLEAFEGKLIHKDCWAQISKLGIMSVYVAKDGRIMLLTRAGKVYYEFATEESLGAKYPDVLEVLTSACENGGEYYNKGIVHISANRLKQVYDVLAIDGTTSCQIALGTHDAKPLLITNTEAVAILMPVMGSEGETHESYKQKALQLLIKKHETHATSD